MIRFRLLGSVDLSDEDGNQVRGVLAQPKRLALLAYLCVTSRLGPLRRDTILGVFWPELDQDRARNALNKSIHFLRQALGDNVLVSRSTDQLVIDSDRLWCDVTKFDDAVTGLQHASAMDLYRGELLSGLFVENSHDFEEWLYHERVRVRTLAAQSASALAVQREKEGDLTTAVICARRAVELSDSDELAVRQLIEMLDRSDDRAGALEAYANFASRLTLKFQAKPSSKTRTLMDRVRTDPDSTTPSTTVIASLVVLPLDNITGDAAQDYFVDGMHDALIAQLGQVYRGRLISRTSAMHYRGTTKSVPEIARELDVDGVVEGSVFRASNTIRIHIQLIQAEPEQHVWSHTYTRDLKDVLALHSEIAQQVAAQITSSLDDSDTHEGARLAGIMTSIFDRIGHNADETDVNSELSEFDADERPVIIGATSTAHALDPAAYDEYLLGRFFLAQGPAGLEPAIDHLEKSIARDPTFALAHAGLAQSALWLAWTGRPDLLTRGHIAARRAVDLDRMLPEAHTVLAMSRLSNWNWTGADDAFTYALRMDPNSVLAHQWYGQLLRVTLRLDEALVAARRAVDLDPHSLTLRAMVGWVFHDQRRHDEALAVYASVLKMQADFGLAIYNEGLSYWMKGLAEPVIERALRAKAVGFTEVYADWLLSIGHALSGNRSRALGILHDLEARHANTPRSLCAAVHSVLGDDDTAFHLLEHALALREPMLPNLTSEPLFDRLSSHPRFLALRASMRLPVNSPAAR